MGQRAKTVNTVSGDVVAEVERRGAATKGPDLSSLEEVGGLGMGAGALQAGLTGELSPGHLVFILGALLPSTYPARELPMATHPLGQTRDTPR